MVRNFDDYFCLLFRCQKIFPDCRASKVSLIGIVGMIKVLQDLILPFIVVSPSKDLQLTIWIFFSKKYSRICLSSIQYLSDEWSALLCDV